LNWGLDWIILPLRDSSNAFARLRTPGAAELQIAHECGGVSAQQLRRVGLVGSFAPREHLRNCSQPSISAKLCEMRVCTVQTSPNVRRTNAWSTVHWKKLWKHRFALNAVSCVRLIRLRRRRRRVRGRSRRSRGVACAVKCSRSQRLLLAGEPSTASDRSDRSVDEMHKSLRS
jgi:hypothetical protein